MTRTTIEIPESVRDQLKEERKSHESNYGDTIERLLGESSGGQLWTEQELRDMISREIEKAQRGR